MVIVTDNLSIDGGSAKVALGSALALAESGLRVTIFAATGEPSAELRDCKNIRIVSTRQGEALASRNKVAGALRGLWNRKARLQMRALLATLDVKKTIVHVHGWTKALSSSVVGTAIAAKFPVVVTLHEYFTVCPTGCLYLHKDARVCTLKPMSIGCITKDCDSRSYAFKLYRILRQLIARTADSIPRGIAAFVTVSEFSREVIKPYLPVTSRFFGVDNPVDAVRTSRANPESNSPFIFIGRLSAEKGGKLFAAAAAKAGVRIVFIGDGPDRAEIERINPDAEFTGWLDHSAVTERMRTARCIVVPSLWYETLGMVVLEAAALGIPAIVPLGTAPYDLIEHGLTGLAFQRGDADDLAAQLLACKDDALIAMMSRNAYDRFWEKPRTLERHRDDLIAVYGKLLGATTGVQVRVEALAASGSIRA